MIDPSTQCFTIEPGEKYDSDKCPCCGEKSHSANGFVYRYGKAAAAYLVRWTSGHSNKAVWEFVIGAWGEGASAQDRYVVRAEYRFVDGPGLMIIDAEGADAHPSLAATCLRRDEVVGKPLAHDVLAIYDTIVMDDDRLASLHPWRPAR